MRVFTGVVFLVIPFIFISTIYSEGGLFGLIVYTMYILATFCSIYLPYAGWKILKGEVRQL